MGSSISISQRSALKRAIRNPALLPLLIQKVSGLDWYDAFEEEGLLRPENNPKPIQNDDGLFHIPPWSVVGFLVSSSSLLREEQNQEYAKKIIKLMKDSTFYAKENDFGNYRTWWQFSQILKNLPHHLIAVDDVNLFGFWLDDKFESGLVLNELAEWILFLLDNFDEHAKNIIFALLEKIYTFNYKKRRWSSEGSVEAELTYKSYSFNQFIEKTSFKLGNVIGSELVMFLEQKLSDILKNQKDDNYSALWRPAIEEHAQNVFSEDVNVLVLVSYREALFGFSESNNSKISEYLIYLLKVDYFTIRRIAIFVIGKKFNSLNSSILESINFSEFFSYHYRHEFWHFLSENYEKIPSEYREKIINLIESIPFNSDHMNEKQIAYEKLIWLSAIKDKDKQVLSIYRHYQSISGVEPDHPDFASYTSSDWVEHKSEISAAEMAAMGVSALVDTLNSYGQKPRSSSVSIEGVRKEFRLFVKNNSDVICRNFSVLKKLNYQFIYELIESYLELWGNNEGLTSDWDLIWKELILFFNEIIENDFFTDDFYIDDKGVNNYKKWIVGSIGRLLEAGCRSDERAFGIGLIDDVRLLLQRLLSNRLGEHFNAQSDAVLVAINSPRGKCLEALINLNLFAFRNFSGDEIKKNEIWNNFELIYNEELDREKSGEYEFYVIAAMYIPNFLYLSEIWINNNLKNLFSSRNEISWSCSIQGFSHVSSSYKNIYFFLRKSGSLVKIIDSHFSKKSVRQRYVQLIAFSYISDLDDINDEDSIIKILIYKNNSDDICHLILFFKSLWKKNNDKVVAKKAIELWGIFNEILDVKNPENRKALSCLCVWSVFIDRLDCVHFDWLMKIAPFANYNHNFHSLISELARLSNEFPIAVAEIWLTTIQQGSLLYPEEPMIEILKNLAGSDRDGAAKAKEVVAKYLSYGYSNPIKWLTDVDSQ